MISKSNTSSSQLSLNDVRIPMPSAEYELKYLQSTTFRQDKKIRIVDESNEDDFVEVKLSSLWFEPRQIWKQYQQPSKSTSQALVDKKTVLELHVYDGDTVSLFGRFGPAANKHRKFVQFDIEPAYFSRSNAHFMIVQHQPTKNPTVERLTTFNQRLYTTLRHETRLMTARQDFFETKFLPTFIGLMLLGGGIWFTVWLSQVGQTSRDPVMIIVLSILVQSPLAALIFILSILFAYRLVKRAYFAVKEWLIKQQLVMPETISSGIMQNIAAQIAKTSTKVNGFRSIDSNDFVIIRGKVKVSARSDPSLPIVYHRSEVSFVS